MRLLQPLPANWGYPFSYLLFSGIVLYGIVGCGPEEIYSENYELPGAWSYADSAVFAYDIADTSRAYDLTLTVEHTDAYATQNLYARFVTHYPDGTVQSEAVSLELADRFGQWLGTCSGPACELSIPLQVGAHYPEPGRYGLTLHQYGRERELPEITGLGLAVTASE